ncbi:Xre family transcriptional regulator [Sediminibacterium goheungense]|uniref:Helix-turn-helix protein n=2 Tax=Sediminibacterium goheungense TaxID=1086393 RepID=A0A4R6IRM9_9BACT|nr:helix-turn-helix protein [Sediminibacterium goheungense]TDO25110.1 Xre family transcriptional regulator [Sediminibacterium goheungense]
MENSNKNWFAMSDPAILAMLGQFLQHTRLEQNKTQQEIASAAGIHRSTLVQIEGGGGGTLLSFIQVMRALQQLHLFRFFETQPKISPLQLAKMDQQKRKRASRKNKTADHQPKTDW